MTEDNVTRQADEVEALASIYGEEWCTVDEANRVYCIRVNDQLDKPRCTLCLQVQLPVDYPSISPPQYQLNAPWLRGYDRLKLAGQLEDIYCDNVGECIIYLWVECIREFLVQLTDEQLTGSGSAHQNQRQKHTTEETDDGADDFDIDELEVYRSHRDLNETGASKADGVQCPVIHHGDPVTDRRSTFQAHLAPVTHKQQIQMVLDKLCENKKIANATHNILAYRLEQSSGSRFIQGCDDDGETHAGSRMLHLLKIMDVRNVLVVVSRWYGGILLGPDRFKHINNCTRQILQQHNYVGDRDERKGPRSGKSK